MMSEYRPCIVDDHKALFHIWTEKSYPVEASPLMGGAPAGQINYLYGVVEYEDGSVHLCVPMWNMQSLLSMVTGTEAVDL